MSPPDETAQAQVTPTNTQNRPIRHFRELASRSVIDLSVSGEVLTLTASGDLDLAERARFPELTERAGRDCYRHVVVDLCGVGFIDSAGAAFLTAVAAVTRSHGGRAVVQGATEQVLFVLEVCGALGGFEVDPAHRCPPVAGPGPWRTARSSG